MHPLLSTLKNIFSICKGITIILITAHRFINRLFASASDADGIFRPFITAPAIHTHSQAINVRDLPGKYRSCCLWAIQFEPASG
jgi:hypothetical protein